MKVTPDHWSDSGQRATRRGPCLGCVPVGLLAVLAMCVGCGASPTNPSLTPVPPAGNRGTLPNLAGPYLGQTPPGNSFTPFAPGIVAQELVNSVTVSPDGREIYWAARDGITVTAMTAEGRWMPPQIVSFGGRSSVPGDDAPVVSPDNRTLFFNAPASGITASGWRFSCAERTTSGWSEARPLPDAINSFGGSHWQLSVTNSGVLYFGVWDAAGARIYRAQALGAVPEPVAALNGLGDVMCPFIAPDESYILFNRLARIGGNNQPDGYYVSFRGQDDQWLEPQRLALFPTESSSFVTRDGQYVFCKSFWASARVIREMRPTEW